MADTDILCKSADELIRVVEQHRHLLTCVMKGGDAPVDECLLLDCPHRRKLRETLAETVEILDETRKAFKSRQLEALRKKLIGVLAEDA